MKGSDAPISVERLFSMTLLRGYGVRHGGHAPGPQEPRGTA